MKDKKKKPGAESKKQRDERIELSDSLRTQVVPDKKTAYKRNPKHKKDLFENFLESLDDNNNSHVINVIKEGFQVCYENMD